MIHEFPHFIKKNFNFNPRNTCKIILILLICFLVLGCSNQSSTPGTSDPIKEISFKDQVKKEIEQNGQLSYSFSPEIANLAWSDPEYLKEFFKDYPGFFYAKGKKIEDVRPEFFWGCEKKESLENSSDCDFMTDIKNIQTKYVFPEREYFLTAVPDKILGEGIFTLLLDGKEIYSAPYCQGTYSAPIQQLRLLKDELTFDFSEGIHFSQQEEAEGEYSCAGRQNIFYQGKTINQTHNVHGSKFLFFYKGIPGFVEFDENGQEYIYFNNKRVSTPFRYITTDFNSDFVFPIFEVYDNGALIFAAYKDYNDRSPYFTQIDLNQFLD